MSGQSAPWPSKRLAFEILLAEAIALAAPDVGAAADDAHPALPAEGLVRGSGVGLFEVVREPVVVVFGAGVAVALARPRLGHDARRASAIAQLEGLFVLRVVGVGQRAAGVDQRHAESGFGQAFGRPASGCAGSHHQDVVLVRGLRLHTV